MERTIDATPLLREVFSGSIKMFGNRDIQFNDLGFHIKLLCGLEGVLHASTHAGENDLGPFLLSETGDAEAKRGVVEHSSHQQSLTFKQSHGSSDRGYG